MKATNTKSVSGSKNLTTTKEGKTMEKKLSAAVLSLITMFFAFTSVANALTYYQPSIQNITKTSNYTLRSARDYLGSDFWTAYWDEKVPDLILTTEGIQGSPMYVTKCLGTSAYVNIDIYVKNIGGNLYTREDSSYIKTDVYGALPSEIKRDIRLEHGQKAWFHFTNVLIMNDYPYGYDIGIRVDPYNKIHESDDYYNNVYYMTYSQDLFECFAQ